MNAKKKLTRRDFLKAAAGATGAMVLGACAPKVVKETVIVEKIVEKPVEKVVKETVIVEGTPQVVEKIITVAPVAEEITLRVPARAGFEPHYDAMIAAFKDKHPNVTIEEDPTMPSGEDEIRFLARAAAGNIIDHIRVGDENPSFYGPRGIMINLRPFMDAEPEFWFNPDVFYQETHIVEPYGHQYSVSTTDNSWAVLLNLQNFEDLGVEVPPFLYGDPDYDSKWSWEGFKETARQLTVDATGKHPGDAGFDKDNVEKYGFAIDINWQQLWPFVYQAGGKVNNDEWTKTLWDTPEALKAMKFVAGMIEEGMCVTPGLANTLGGALSLIKDGVIAMTINGTWTYFHFLEDVEAGKMRLSYAPLPHDATIATIQLGVQNGIPTISKHKELAWEWIRSWFEHFDVAVKAFEEMGHNPWVLGSPLKKEWNGFLKSGKATVIQDYGQDHIDLTPLYEDSLQAQISPMPYGPFFPETRDIFYSEIGPALNGEVTVEEAVAAMMPQQQEVMDRWQEVLKETLTR